MQVITLLDSATTNATGAWVQIDGGSPVQRPFRTYQVVVTGTGAVSVTATIQYSNNGANPIATGSTVISPSGTTLATDGVAVSNAWPYVRVVLSSISGTGATVTVTAGV